MPHTLLKPLLLFVITLSLSACQSLTQKESEKALQEQLKAYEASMRWGFPGQAYNFLSPELAKTNKVQKGLDRIKVTQYKVLQRPDLIAEDVAALVAVIGYVHEDRQVERSLTDRQRWEYDKEKNRWFRTNPIPVFK